MSRYTRFAATLTLALAVPALMLAQPAIKREPARPIGSVEGDALYNAYCAVCHGIEGHLNRKPPISADLSKRLSRLAVPPANLRDPAKLKAQDDEDDGNHHRRAKAQEPPPRCVRR